MEVCGCIDGCHTIVSVFVSMITLSPLLTLLVVILIVVLMVLVKVMGGLSAKYFGAQQKSLGRVDGFIEEHLNDAGYLDHSGRVRLYELCDFFG